MWIPGIQSLEQKRITLLRRIPDSPLKSYLKVPVPDKNASVYDTEFLALDFETTGLDDANDAILTIGYTLIKQGRVLMKHNGHHLIKINKTIPEKSVVIHKITDDRVHEGAHIHDVMETLLQNMAGRVLLVHFARIEKGFLNAACQQIYGVKPPLLFVDTFEIEKRRLLLTQPEATPNMLRLFNIRERYSLPRYNAHSALEDSIATAELFLAQVVHGNNLDSPVKDFLLKRF